MVEAKVNQALFESIYNIAASLTSTLNEEEVLNNIMNLVSEIFHPQDWSLFSYDEAKQMLSFRLVVGKESEKLLGTSFSIDKGVAGLCLKQKKTIIIPDASKDERVLNLQSLGDFKTESIIAVPMYSKGAPLGVIELINAQSDCFLAHKIKLLETLADFAAISMQNSRYLKIIEAKATIDDTTTLYNARYMHTILEKEIARFNREKKPFGLIFFDLDHFKNVNDNYGHLIGSQLLREVATILQKSSRPTDWGIRYGGDEFVLILPGATLEATTIVAKRVRKSLSDTVFFQKEGYNISIPASFGIAIFPDDATTSEEVIRAADHAMYKAKELGRDCICHKSEEIS